VRFFPLGLDFYLAGSSWPDDRAPDWDALFAAVSPISLQLAQIIDEAHLLEQDDEESLLLFATGEVHSGIEMLRDALAAASRTLTVVSAAGHSVLLDGGVSAGGEPSDTWYGVEALTLTGLLGNPVSVYGNLPRGTPVPRAGRAFVDAIAPITGPSRLAVAELPLEPDWEAGRAAAGPDDAAVVDRLRDVVAGAYTRTAAVRKVENVYLFIGDRAFPDGAAKQIDAWQRNGVLTALGGRRLDDLRLTGAQCALGKARWP
jgi:hypothetical protein